MQLSICTIALRKHPPEEAFPMLARWGYKNLDVLAYGHQAHFSRFMDKPRRRQIIELAASLGQRIVSLAGDVGDNFNSDSEAERRREVALVCEEIDLAVEAGAAIIRISLGSGMDADKTMVRSVPCLKKVAAYAEKQKMFMGMENHSGSIAENPALIAELCRAVGSPCLGVIYEPGNLFGLSRDYKKDFETQKPHIVHVHIKDGYPCGLNKANAPCVETQLHCTVFGKGQLDIPWIMKALGGIGYHRFISVEYESWHPEFNLPPNEEGLIQAREYMAQWLK